MATDAAESRLRQAQWHDDTLDIAKPINSAHGQYALGLHVVLVHAERWCNAEQDFCELTRDSIREALINYNCYASRITPLADHVHFTMRLHYEVAPGDVIVSVMNELCRAHGNLRMWQDSYYVGAVGSYDMAAVRRKLV